MDAFGLAQMSLVKAPMLSKLIVMKYVAGFGNTLIFMIEFSPSTEVVFESKTKTP